jgi:hypothetical protein
MVVFPAPPLVFAKVRIGIDFSGTDEHHGEKPSFRAIVFGASIVMMAAMLHPASLCRACW